MHTLIIQSKNRSDIYPKYLKTYRQKYLHTGVYIADLFITAQTWKQPRCSSVGEWINKLVNPDNMLFSTKKD